ncbi:sialidase family protein [Limnochorda pilosa]|uniref:Exo-alpha-sialidase n=1 Tax=Limnochorda pilosa TaxID=1555112 RepID=A0A0K2SH37_LIMPI|nr:sialidase family protein [Limnochorda pilosa]BAS26431.1 hypothetical protein LIP_0574 [Limnochorda pilosa]
MKHACGWRPAAVAAVAILLAAGVTFAAVFPTWAQGVAPSKLGKAEAGPSLDLLAPVKPMLSGRAWLLVEGIDPGLRRRPGWGTLTRLDWQALDGPMGGPSSRLGSPSGVMQAPGAALVPFRNPAPAFSRDLLITRDFSQTPFQTEPHLAADPQDPDHLVVGVIDYNFPTMSTYVSLDGGATWEGPHQAPYLPDDQVSGGDPVLAFDREGDLYLASISIGVEDFTVGPLFLSTLVSSIAVARSSDGGYAWPQVVSTARSGVKLENQQIDATGRLRGTLSVGFLDKPWMAVGPDPSEPERDVIYVTYTDFVTRYDIRWIGELPVLMPDEVETTIRLVRSVDGGATWSEPVAVSPTVRRSFGEVEQPADVPGAVWTDRVVQGAQPAVAPDGSLYVAWFDSTDDGSMKGKGAIRVVRSDDGGKSFARPVTAASFNEIGFRPHNAFFRYWAAGFPQLAAGPDGGLHLVYTARPGDPPGDDGDVFYTRSADGGATWSGPLRLNGDDGSALQFFPSVDVDPSGSVHVMWGDMRDDASQTRYHIYYTRSEDGGATWGFKDPELGLEEPDTRVTDFASNPNRGFPYGLFLGDYFSIAATGEDVHMVWADTRLGEFGPLNQKIGFARRKAIRAPGIFVSPPAGSGGQKITVQGFDFQPEMNVFIQLEDATIATARTNREGRFTTSLFVPVTGEGAQSLRVLDESGNGASTSYYTEFGFGNLQQLHDDLSRQLGELKDVLEQIRQQAGGAEGQGSTP